MSEHDMKTGKELLEEDFIKKNPAWLAELELMVRTKQKAEIQALSSSGQQNKELQRTQTDRPDGTIMNHGSHVAFIFVFPSLFPAQVRLPVSHECLLAAEVAARRLDLSATARGLPPASLPALLRGALFRHPVLCLITRRHLHCSNFMAR
jgi:hypothetical protein